ncbi:MAG: MFS transporter [Deltaproteobacteria bacterium]|nr:MFS transporter [Deltaproteobacteria bacterium]
MSDKHCAPGAKGFGFVLRALKHRNFRLFFSGQLVSLIGTWMQQVAISWLVYRLTDSPFLLGVVVFSGQIPTFLLAPFAGVMADRWNRHRILVITQTLSMALALVLSLLVLTGAVQVWHIIAAAACLGVINSFDMPTRQSFFIHMIEKREDLGNAIALNSSIVNSARFLGPTIAGVLIAAAGEGVCILINAISYTAVICALLMMRIRPEKRETKEQHVFTEFKEGFSYTYGFAPMRALLFLVSLISLAGSPYSVLMPVFARDILHGGPHTLGFLMGSAGIGALTGTVYLASRSSIRGLGKVIVVATAALSTGIIAFSLSRYVALSMFFIFFAGFGMMVNMASANTILQTIVDDNKRGRVMSFYTMSFMGMAPFGSLLAGYAASRIGAPDTLVIGGSICFAGAILFARNLPKLKEHISPIYAKKGI